MNSNDEMDSTRMLDQKGTSIGSTTGREDRVVSREGNDENDNDPLVTVVASVIVLIISILGMVIFISMFIHTTWSRRSVTLSEAMANLAMVMVFSSIAWLVIMVLPYLSLSATLKWWKSRQRRNIKFHDSLEDYHDVKNATSSIAWMSPEVIDSPLLNGSRWRLIPWNTMENLVIFAVIFGFPFVEVILLGAEVLGDVNLGGLGILALSSREWYLVIGLLFGGINALFLSMVFYAVRNVRRFHRDN